MGERRGGGGRTTRKRSKEEEEKEEEEGEEEEEEEEETGKRKKKMVKKKKTKREKKGKKGGSISMECIFSTQPHPFHCSGLRSVFLAHLVTDGRLAGLGPWRAHSHKVDHIAFPKRREKRRKNRKQEK